MTLAWSKSFKHVLIAVFFGGTVLLTLASQPVEADGPVVYVVSYGDTLMALSRKYNVSLDALLRLNRLGKDGWLYAGQRLLIPAQTNTTAAPSMGTVTIRLSNVPRLQQQQTLTCEETAVAMATRGRVSEAQLVRAMLRSANPFEGIRGRTNAPTWGTLVDYGAYAQAVQIGLRRLGVDSGVLYGQTYEAFKASIIAELKAGRPVVWWTTYHEMWQSPVRVQLLDGRFVKLVRYEHTVTLVGLTTTGFIYHDPYDGAVRFVSFADHQRVSSYFDNMALTVQ